MHIFQSKSHRTVAFLLLGLVSVVCNDLRAQNFSVGHTTITFVDSSRNNRNILTEVYYPADVAGDDVSMVAGEFPIVSFGHGFVMVWSAYENIWTDLVSRGYIVAFPRTEGNIFPNHQNLGLDLAFIVDEIFALGQTPSSLFENHVTDRAAIGGHSMGGGATYLGASQSSSLVKTLFSLAAADTNPSAIAAANQLSLPTLLMAGTSDDVSPPPQNSIPIYDNLSEPNSKLYVGILGGGHCFFANDNFNCSTGEAFSSGNISITRAEQQQIASEYLNAWLDRFLKEDCSAYNQMIAGIDTDSRVEFDTNLVVPGDLNQDGVVNLLDVAPFVDILSNGAFQVEADLNCDDAVNLLDVDFFIALLS